MPRYDIAITPPVGTAQYSGAGTNYIVEANNKKLYCFYINSAIDLCMKTSTSGGIDWSAPTVLYTGSITALSVWYDRWSGITTSDYIHISWIDSGNDDIWYTTINTASSDAKSNDVAVFLGASTATGGALSIARAVGGNVYIAGMIDAGAEGGFYRLPTANVPNGAWDAARTTVFEAITGDMVILAPDLISADNQDMLCIFWDASADTLSRKNYDDSANTWAETTISASMVDLVATGQFPHFAIEMDLENNKILFAAWSNVDSANADLRFWEIDATSITEKTNVVLNSVDDQGLVAIQKDISTGDIYVFYAGKSDGSETWATGVNIYYKRSTDGGTTWGSETLCTNYTNYYRSLIALMRPSSTTLATKIVGYEFNANLLVMSQDIRFSKANYILGI